MKGYRKKNSKKVSKAKYRNGLKTNKRNLIRHTRGGTRM